MVRVPSRLRILISSGNSAHFSWDSPETDGGGGIRFAGGTMTVTNCTFAENPGVTLYCDCVDTSSRVEVNNTIISLDDDHDYG